MRLRFFASFARVPFTSLVLLAAAAPAFAHPPVHRGPTPPHPSHPHVSTIASRPAGMAPERATQIQTALIKAGYLTGEPSGAWDASTQAAMEKLQSDNGWQTKLVPDSRAIIKLGLGPQASAAGNAFSEPAAEASESPVTNGGTR